MGRPFPGQRIAAATTGAPGPVPEISKGLPGRGADAPAGALGFYEDLTPVYLGAAGNAKFSNR